MAYETAARSAELLVLNVEDLDLPDRRARVRRKDLAMLSQNMGSYIP